MEVVLGFGCQPIQAWWGETRGKCINKEAFTYFTNVTNMVTDLWIFSMPIPVILGLHAAKERRVILCFMFGIGAATCAISAARLSFVFGVASTDFTCKLLFLLLYLLSTYSSCYQVLNANPFTLQRGRGFAGYPLGLGTLRCHSLRKSSSDISSSGHNQG